MSVLSWIFGVFGALVCALNIYLSLLRYPLHRLKGGTKQSYKYVSGFPLVGFYVLALLHPLHDQPIAIAFVIILALLDPGGIITFLVVCAAGVVKRRL